MNQSEFTDKKIVLEIQNRLNKSKSMTGYKKQRNLITLPPIET